MDTKTYTVSQVSRMAHVTVRTLHHYDDIGLLLPSQRSDAGYRLYTEADLQRLQQILLFRELGFTLDAIAALLEQSDADRREALLMQRARVQAELQNKSAVLRAIETAIQNIAGDETMSGEDIFEGMDHFEHAQYADEARERWGDTEAYQESMRRAQRYTKQDWARMQEESEAITRSLAAAMAAGKAPDSEEATSLVEQHRLLIDRWFYPCSRAFHVNLGEMYVSDARFTTTYDRVRPGLARYICDAIVANARKD